MQRASAYTTNFQISNILLHFERFFFLKYKYIMNIINYFGDTFHNSEDGNYIFQC